MVSKKGMKVQRRQDRKNNLVQARNLARQEVQHRNGFHRYTASRSTVSLGKYKCLAPLCYPKMKNYADWGGRRIINGEKGNGIRTGLSLKTHAGDIKGLYFLFKLTL